MSLRGRGILTCGSAAILILDSENDMNLQRSKPPAEAIRLRAETSMRRSVR
jgi:hypothetical protein